MTFRALFVALVLSSTAAFAGGDGDQGPAPRPIRNPQSINLCDGLYQGALMYQPGPLTLEIRPMSRDGDAYVTAFWNGQSWMGQGFCQQTSPCDAEVQFQFQGTNIQRGVIKYDANTGVAVLDGQVFGGDSFRLFRQ